MRTLYNKDKKGSENNNYQTPQNLSYETNSEEDGLVLNPLKSENNVPQNINLNYTESDKAKFEELQTLFERSSAALEMVDDIVLKNYLTKLSSLPVLKNEDTSKDNIILFKINKMVYEKDEYATDKFISVISSMTYAETSIFLIVDGHKSQTDFYLGIKCLDENRNKSSIAETLYDSLLGQFPGAEISDYSYKENDISKQDVILNKIKEGVALSSCVGIPSYKNSKGEYTNANFIQGIEKFASAMQGKEYTAIILATNTPHSEILRMRNAYEDIYAELSSQATNQLAFSSTESLADAYTRSKGFSYGKSITDTKGTSDTKGSSHTHTDGTSKSIAHTKGESKDNAWGKISKLASPLMEAGAVLNLVPGGQIIGIPMMAVGGAAGLGGVFGSKQLSKSTTETEGTNSSDAYGTNESHTTNKSRSEGINETESQNESQSKTSTIGKSKNFTITVQNKHIQEVLKRIDKQLSRIEIGESTGLWATGAYFVSYGNDRAIAEIAATIFRSIMQGEQSGVECSSINTWYHNNSEIKELLSYVSSISHPTFEYSKSIIDEPMDLLPVSLLSSKELAIMMGLPRKSVPGLPVIEHISLAKEVVKLDNNETRDKLVLGSIFDQGKVRENNRVYLDIKSLTQHCFVTGSTGCGKSNTIYYLIDQIRNHPDAPKFMIIEPAKGEYKNVFGNEHIYGTNPLISNLLKINPFKFPEGVHVLEHADRLIEIFNVCWPMYAAMPAVLKEAVLNSYEDCGWDLVKSVNKYSSSIFPTFSDLIWELESVIEMSQYSEEVKSNYKGSLVTRVKSLANGINGEIFSGQEIGDEKLFDENVIIDISRIGSQETKSLIMGILIMRLNEYRANSGIEANSDLRHITVLEEAHNLLKKCSQEQNMEGSNLAGKSVEMISNSIAEMRTYGEGFIIVDQSPGAVDISAIRNTNTKIIMRLPEESDRNIAGKSAAMKDNQVDEIAKLPTGVAVVYQNDWEDPVLCKIGKFNSTPLKYEFKEEKSEGIDQNALKIDIINFMMQKKVITPLKYNLDFIKNNITSSTLPTSVKINVLDSIQEFETTGHCTIWEDNEFPKFSWVIAEILNIKDNVIKILKQTSDFDEVNSRIKISIKTAINGIDEVLILPLIQCFLRDLSTINERYLKFYSYWLTIARERVQ